MLENQFFTQETILRTISCWKTLHQMRSIDFHEINSSPRLGRNAHGSKTSIPAEGVLKKTHPSASKSGSILASSEFPPQRCCKPQNSHPHARRGAQKKMSATMRGSVSFVFCNTSRTGTRLQKVIRFQMFFQWF